MEQALRFKITTAWCGKCGTFRPQENGTCAECNKRRVQELKTLQRTPAKIGLAASLIAEGYTQRIDSRDYTELDAAREQPCKLCGRECYAIILRKAGSRIAISRCVGCGNEVEF